MNLGGNHVLITGGTSGIGLALAEAFLVAGSSVAICGRSPARLEEARHKHPALLTQVCDVSRDDDRRQLWASAQAVLPDLNVLVNNAGVQRDIDFTHGLRDFDHGDNELRVNLEAPIALTGLFAPLLAKNPSPVLVNVSSGLGFVPMPRVPVYCASKAGVHAFTVAVRAQLASLGIRVVEVIPPAVDTGLNPAGRAARGGFRAGLDAPTFVAAVMRDLAAGATEIGYGMTAGLSHAPQEELRRRFDQMNPGTLH